MKILDATAAAAVIVRHAATTLVLRDGAHGLEVLMVRRSLKASFMPGAYVFPGGAVDAADGEAACDETAQALQARLGRVMGVGPLARACAVAALRECEEECNLRLGADRAAPGVFATSVLQPWSRWVTPFGIPKRFDTLFFVAPAPQDQVPQVDAGETTQLAWVRPADALSAREAGQFQMEFATVATVKSLLPHAGLGVAQVLAEAAARSSMDTIHPRLVLGAKGGMAGVLLPGEPGYDQAFAAPTAA